MCGIYGFVGKIKKGKQHRVLALMKQLAIETEIRGLDGTGFYSIGKNEIIVEKDGIEASEFVEVSRNFERSILENDPHIWVGHNREASVGNIDSKSAHPFMGDKYLMVHNGTCRLVFDLIDANIQAKLETESDSEAILQLIERDGIEKTFREISAYSIVIANYQTDKLYFGRDSKRPMVIYDLRKQYGIRMFCSTCAIGDAALESVRINPLNAPNFKTKPFHLYSANYKDGEFTNEGRYYKPIIRPAATQPSAFVSNYGQPPQQPTLVRKVGGMGRRIYEKYFKIDRGSKSVV